MFELDRFREAQDGRPGFAEALRELRAGAKTGHWIWYVFPQLRGLGRSPMAVRYGLDGVEEARAYLRDPVLAQRLALATSTVREQLTAGVPIETLMGAAIDALKLVSSLTLFSRLARSDNAQGAPPALADEADAILQMAAAQGYPRCAFTDGQLRASGRD